MSFWSKFAKVLNIGAKVAEVAAPVVAIKDPKLGAIVGQAATIVDSAIPDEDQPKEETKQ